jgi:hypothetical protein
MKTLITSILLLISFLSYSQEYTIVQINASWNRRNDIKLPKQINDSKVIYGILEDQPLSIKKSAKAVPIIIIYKNNKPLRQWSADLSFKLNLTKEEIADAIRKDKQTYKRARSN